MSTSTCLLCELTLALGRSVKKAALFLMGVTPFAINTIDCGGSSEVDGGDGKQQATAVGA